MESLIIGEYYTVIDKILPYNITRRWQMKVTGYNPELCCYDINSSLSGNSIYLDTGAHFKNSLIIKGSFPYKTETDFCIATNQPFYFFITTDYEGLKCMLSERCINLSQDLLKRIYYRPSLPINRALWLIAPFEPLFSEHPGRVNYW